MPIIELKFTVSELQLQTIEALRGKIPQADFLRNALQLGLCDFMDDSCRVTKDMIYQGIAAQTENYQTARKSRMIDTPEESPPNKPAAQAQTLFQP